MVIPHVNIWIWDVQSLFQCLNFFEFEYVVFIFFDLKTNICTWDISAQVKKSLRYPITFRDYLSFTMDIRSCQPGLIPRLTGLPMPLEHCASFWSGWHDHAQPLFASMAHDTPN